MRVTSARWLEEQEQSGTYEVRFESGPDSVCKVLRFEGQSNREFIKKLFSGIARVVVEAERDFAYKHFGEEWRKHVGSGWVGKPSDEQQKLIDQIYKLLSIGRLVTT